jgi:predicted transcriptional regulator
MTSLRHILATNIKERRYVLGISQAKLAEAANIATAYIAMIEVEKNLRRSMFWSASPKL